MKVNKVELVYLFKNIKNLYVNYRYIILVLKKSILEFYFILKLIFVLLVVEIMPLLKDEC